MATPTLTDIKTDNGTDILMTPTNVTETSECLVEFKNTAFLNTIN